VRKCAISSIEEVRIAKEIAQDISQGRFEEECKLLA